MNNEEIYDSQVAPLLLQACKVCEDNKIPFIAVVEYSTGDFGRTEYLGLQPSVAMRILSWAAHAKDNVDKLIGCIIKYAREHGHGSAFLEILKVPTKPNN